MVKNLSIYCAGSLFNGRETYFNSRLTEELEKRNYKVNLPQRDGFEFGNLEKSFLGKLPEKEIESAVQNIIYFLDMGIFVLRSDIILANFDEPPDQGVDIETTYAKTIGKFVLGFRTDIRSPYGNLNNNFRGMHFFPGKQTTIFLHHSMPSKTPDTREKEMNDLVNKIDYIILSSEIKINQPIPKYVMQKPNIRQIFEGVELLFNGVGNIHSELGLEEIASRYISCKDKLTKLSPKIIF